MGASAGRAARSPVDRLTLLDLAALILGVALVLSLPWLNRPEFLAMSRWTWASWKSYPFRLSIAAEALGKAALALVPVVLVRSARRKGMARPAEYLLACAGLPWLARGIYDLAMLAWMQRHGVDGDMLGVPVEAAMRWHTESFRPFVVGWLLVAVAATLAAVAARKRLPAPWTLILVMAAWLGLHESLIEERFHEVVSFGFLWVQPMSEPIAEGLFQFLVSLPILLLFAIPTVASLAGRATPGRSWSRLEKAGAGLAGASFAATIGSRGLGCFENAPWPDCLEAILGSAAAVVAAAMAALALHRLLGPGWDRFFAASYDGGRPAAIPLEPQPPCPPSPRSSA